MNTPTIYRWLGGRKNALGLLYAALITFMAFHLDADFEAYALWLAAALLGTSTLHVIEDTKRGGS